MNCWNSPSIKAIAETGVKIGVFGAWLFRGPIPFVARVSLGLMGCSDLLRPTVFGGTFL